MHSQGVSYFFKGFSHSSFHTVSLTSPERNEVKSGFRSPTSRSNFLGSKELGQYQFTFGKNMISSVEHRVSGLQEYYKANT